VGAERQFILKVGLDIGDAKDKFDELMKILQSIEKVGGYVDKDLLFKVLGAENIPQLKSALEQLNSQVATSVQTGMKSLAVSEKDAHEAGNLLQKTLISLVEPTLKSRDTFVSFQQQLGMLSTRMATVAPVLSNSLYSSLPAVSEFREQIVGMIDKVSELSRRPSIRLIDADNLSRTRQQLYQILEDLQGGTSTGGAAFFTSGVPNISLEGAGNLKNALQNMKAFSGNIVNNMDSLINSMRTMSSRSDVEKMLKLESFLRAIDIVKNLRAAFDQMRGSMAPNEVKAFEKAFGSLNPQALEVWSENAKFILGYVGNTGRALEYVDRVIDSVATKAERASNNFSRMSAKLLAGNDIAQAENNYSKIMALATAYSQSGVSVVGDFRYRINTATEEFKLAVSDMMRQKQNLETEGVAPAKIGQVISRSALTELEKLVDILTTYKTAISDGAARTEMLKKALISSGGEAARQTTVYKSLD